MSFTHGKDRSDLLSVEAAANRLSISTSTLRHWVSARRIEFVRVGRLTKFEPRTLDTYIDERREKAVKR